MARLVSLAVLSVLLVFFLMMFYTVMVPYLMPLFLAAVAAILFQPVYRWCQEKTGGRNAISAGLTTTILALTILLPMLLAIGLTGLELNSFVQKQLSGASWDKMVSQITTAVDQVIAKLEPYLPRAIDREQVRATLMTQLKQQGQALSAQAGSIAASTWGLVGTMIQFVVDLTVFLLAVYFFLCDGSRMVGRAHEIIPVQKSHLDRLFTQFAKVTRSVVVGTVLSAIGQGIAMAFLAWLFGIGHIFVIGMVTTVFAMVPMIGAAGMYIPLTILLVIEGAYIKAGILFLIGFFIVSSIDNVVRAYVLNNDVQMHPLLAFVSMLGGLAALGLWGIFIGPIVASVLYALVKIFNEELREYIADRQKSAAEAESVPAPGSA